MRSLTLAEARAAKYKDPLRITAWLDTALKKEQEKYKKCPVTPDLVPRHEVSQGWGFVVAGYFLVEQSFKAILYVRNKRICRIHELLRLFNSFDQYDQDTLREYFTDFKAASGGHISIFPFTTLDDFLENLDGDKVGRNHIGSFDWRYFIIEENRSREMPLVSVEYLHEITYGSTRVVEHSAFGHSAPRQFSYSWRMQRERTKKYIHWYTVRRNSEGWNDLGDRVEILWGPDYRDRYDLYVFRDKRIASKFATLPSDIDLPVVDKRTEIEVFDVQQGLRSIGVSHAPSPADSL